MKKILGVIVNYICGFQLKTLHCFGKAIGLGIWYAVPKRRRYTIQTVAERLQVSQAEATRIAKESYLHNGCAFLELFHVGSFGIKDLGKKLSLNPPERYDEMVNMQRPVVVVTAHLGSWELMAGMLGDCSPKRSAQVVVRRQHNKTMNEFIFKLRGASGAEVLDHRQAAPKVLAALRENGLVGFLVDHNTQPREAIFLPFIGKTAAVNMGPALLALRARAVIFPAFLIRTFGEAGSEPHYELQLEEPLDTAELQGPLKDQIRQVAEYYTEKVEKNVRKWPEQWFWMHRRWKTQPEDLEKK